MSADTPARGTDAFRAYHRHRRRLLLVRRGPVAFAVVLALSGAAALLVSAPPARGSGTPAAVVAAAPSAVAAGAPSAPPSQSPPSSQSSQSAPSASSGGAGPAGPVPGAGDAAASTVMPDVPPGVPLTPPSTTLPVDPDAAAEPAVAVAPAPSGPVLYAIDITATGYQREIDKCQWVRMDLGAVAPIVGAHTRCGGTTVLQMRPGDAVRLTGQGLDGAYVVQGSRDAHAGDDAAQATSGMTAAVILQTCYPETSGRVRLVALEPA